jgi:hypothetical protein
MNGSSRCTLGAETIVSAPCVGYSNRYPRELCQPLSTDRSRRGAGYFLCVAKESNQRKATARGRPSASLALQVISGPCAKLARSRLRRATCSDTRPALPRCRPASPRHPRAAEQRRPAATSTGLSPRSRRAAQGARGSLRACLSERPQGASLQARPRPPAAQGSRRSRPDSWARLSLVTFFVKTKKVTGRAALKRDVDGRGPSSAAARSNPTAHRSIAGRC